MRAAATMPTATAIATTMAWRTGTTAIRTIRAGAERRRLDKPRHAGLFFMLRGAARLHLRAATPATYATVEAFRYNRPALRHQMGASGITRAGVRNEKVDGFDHRGR